MFLNNLYFPIFGFSFAKLDVFAINKETQYQHSAGFNKFAGEIIAI